MSDRNAMNSEKGTLYVVATPIGNLADITLRALQTLQQVQHIACEDTRVTRILCQHHQIDTPLTAYHEHNADAALPRITGWLQQGESVALVSDAGTPLISDPGYRLIQALQLESIRVVPIPGVSSVTCAASAAGLPTDQLHFSGFLPTKAQARLTKLEALSMIDATLIMFESANRLPASLGDMVAVLGNRQAVIAREMTKYYEEFHRGTLQELVEHYEQHPQVKGEVVVLCAPPEKEVVPVRHYQPLLEALLPHHSVKHAAALIANASGLPRNALYQLALSLKS